MHEFRTIATQSKRRGGNICYHCFKQLVRREYSNSKSPTRSKTLSQAFIQSLEQGKEWKFGPTPILAPFSLVTQNSGPGRPPKPKSRSKAQHSPDSQSAPESYIYKSRLRLGNRQEASQSAYTTGPIHDEKTPYQPRICSPATNRDDFKQSSSKSRHDIRDSIDGNKNVGHQTKKESSRSRMRFHVLLDRSLSQRPNNFSSAMKVPVEANQQNSLKRSTASIYPVGSALRLYSTSARVQAAAAVVHTSGNNQSSSSAMNMTIRDKLRQFQKTIDNATAKDKAALELALSSIGVSTNADVSETVDKEEDHDLNDQEELDLDESMTGVRPVLEPGDLFELDSKIDFHLAVVTAVFAVGSARHIQFVTSNSTWEHRIFPLTKQPTFAIRRFFKMSELADVKRHLPKKHISSMGFEQEQDNHGILPAEITRSVIEKMQIFQDAAHEVYQQHAAEIDNAFDLLSKPHETTILSLEDITREVLKISKSAAIQNETLYAVHKACALYNFGFLLDRFHWHSREFELLSKKDVEVIEHVRGWTRQHSDYMVGRLGEPKTSKKSILDMFADEIRPIVLKSRNNRKSLSGGHLGPSKLQLDEMENGIISYKSAPGPTISPNSMIIFEFLKLFADRRFDRRGKDLLQSLASMVLKSTGLYGNDAVFNNHAPTNLLKECGILSPWQAPSYLGGRWSDPYENDHTPGSKLLTEAQKETELGGLENDTMKELRHDFGDMLVYCIDSESTIDVDDGISLEKTSEHGTYWIHVHVANPTAFIPQYSKISALAQLSRTSIYLPDRVNRMLPLHPVWEKLSLQAGRPTLTISTKINMDGMVLDRQIRNGIINNVLHITPEMLSDFNDDTSFPYAPRKEFVVGHFPVPPVQKKRTGSPLSVEAVNELQIMKRLGDAWVAHEAKTRNDKWSFRSPQRPSIKVHHQKIQDVSPTHFRQFFGDPTISISLSSWDPYSNFPIEQKRHRGLVTSIMQIANNSAAEWCAQRGVPVLFRGCSFEARTDLNTEAARPFHNSGNIVIDFQEFCRRWSNLQIVTKKEMSTQKITHEAIGVDAYITVTSPLRRYDDMVSHWQIEAALQEEARLGRPLVEHDFHSFPFPEEMIKKEIAKSIYTSHINVMQQQYIIAHWNTEFLIRGVLFEECKDFPKLFTFYITHAAESKLHGVVAELSIRTGISLDQVSIKGILPEVGQIWKIKAHEEHLRNVGISWQLVERVS